MRFTLASFRYNSGGMALHLCGFSRDFGAERCLFGFVIGELDYKMLWVCEWEFLGRRFGRHERCPTWEEKAAIPSYRAWVAVHAWNSKLRRAVRARLQGVRKWVE